MEQTVRADASGQVTVPALIAVVVVTIAALVGAALAAEWGADHDVSYLGWLTVLLAGVGVGLVALGLWGSPWAAPVTSPDSEAAADAEGGTGGSEPTRSVGRARRSDRRLIALGVVVLVAAIPCAWKLADTAGSASGCTVEIGSGRRGAAVVVHRYPCPRGRIAGDRVRTQTR